MQEKLPIGGERNQGSQRAAAANKPSQRGYILANPVALITIHDLEVEEHEMVPTHSFLRIEVSKNPMKEEMQCLREVGPFKQLFENRLQDITKDMEEKEAMQKRKYEVAKLKECMGENFKRTKEKFEKNECHTGQGGARRWRKRTSKP